MAERVMEYCLSVLDYGTHTALQFIIPELGDVKDESEHITLRVVGSEGSTVQFKIKRSTPLRKLKKAYCDKQGGAIDTLRFRYDGSNILDEDTPQVVAHSRESSNRMRDVILREKALFALAVGMVPYVSSLGGCYMCSSHLMCYGVTCCREWHAGLEFEG
ncbi:small ubiquitin-related modifier 3 [Apostichopus japonicus]|uniref:Small ubiquitin-related modifier 3 n=1 Tax=Stichopus japonicus TaxID=307972 RepID=A0A2G8JNI0_STIJA|nr:small ubiquitin-related modifier 3 [Apostichopus japonicus]